MTKKDALESLQIMCSTDDFKFLDEYMIWVFDYPHCLLYSTNILNFAGSLYAHFARFFFPEMLSAIYEIFTEFGVFTQRKAVSKFSGYQEFACQWFLL